MTFSDFVESVVGVPICCALKQYLDKFYESYAKNPEKRIYYPRGSVNHILLTLLPVLLQMYEDMKMEEI